MSLSVTRILLRPLARPATRAAIRHYTPNRRPTDPDQGGYARADDRFQYDMKAPLLDAGIANIFQTDEHQLTVSETLPTGFRLSTGNTVHAPLLIVNNQAFKLNIPPPTRDARGQVANPLQILCKDALTVLDLVTPKPEILVVGGGARVAMLSSEARAYLTRIGVKVEIAASRHAVGTFTTLCEEGRNAALLALPAAVA
ncbi:hypothetical protein LPJ73_002957 [Coemansia sp. RSA 2703]|nr:hypothetical protein LPJ73_002957 [Coemansia sp. RSA 2703]KAJ2363167.1 hypothetical protein IW150_006809 [Coemansia sp. RSA 2607]KAJ2381016.1 hypothetical protein GGI05_006120 [Coemansia sp. RSA 2603]